MENREFTVESAYAYDRASTGRWLRSHLLRFPLLPTLSLAGTLANNALLAVPPLLIGRAFDTVLSPTPDPNVLLVVAALVLATGLLRAL